MGGIYMLPAADAGGETRTMTLYSVNTKEKLTTTYMRNGKHVASELAKINHLLRDWRSNSVVKMDTDTIDLMWELHADLGSKAPIHIISGYRSPKTNAMLKSIGRNVANRSMHTQGRAIDLYFPDVSTERLRNSALVRDVGGVGYYPRSGSSGFVHVDSGRVRHWPGIGSSQMAKIRRDYRKTVGARLGGGQAVQVASAERPSAAEQGYPTPTPRPRPIEVLMMAAAQMTVEPAAAPVAVPNFAQVAARPDDNSPPSTPKLDPKADLALARMTIEPVAAPAPRHNFAATPSPVRDTVATELAPEFDSDRVAARVIEIPPLNTGTKSRAEASGHGGFLTALRDGIAASAEDLRSWPAQLIRGAESLIWRDDSDRSLASAGGPAPMAEAAEPFPPITAEDAAELEMIIAALRSRANYDAKGEQVRPAKKTDRLSTIRARKGDLILTAPPPPYSATASAAQPVNLVAVQAFEKLLQEPAE